MTTEIRFFASRRKKENVLDRVQNIFYFFNNVKITQQEALSLQPRAMIPPKRFDIFLLTQKV